MIDRTLSVGSCSRPAASPRGQLPRLARYRGFTLVEVLMSVVLMGIGVALALPSFRDMVEKRQVTNAAEQLASFVNTAQGISMKRNRDVTIKYKYQDAALWCVGATLDADCTCLDPEAEDYCEIDSQAFVLDNSHTGSLELLHSMGTESEGFYSFEPERGLASGTVLPLTMELRSPSGEFRLNLMVNQVGRVLLCSGDDSHAVPGYGRCPTGQPEEES